MQKKPLRDRGAITLSREIKNEFRKFCIVQDLKPNQVIVEIVSAWLKQQKKKITLPTINNNTTSTNP
jgi:hypothetical protein